MKMRVRRRLCVRRCWLAGLERRRWVDYAKLYGVDFCRPGGDFTTIAVRSGRIGIIESIRFIESAKL